LLPKYLCVRAAPHGIQGPAWYLLTDSLLAVQQSPLDLFLLPNVGKKSLREVQTKLKTLGLSLGMTLDSDSHSAAILGTVAASIQATEK
jgi:hypothetical protein